ncbi:hypothetical protein Bbelb_143500 [Branchiostoma belcheri]|nr:hypothetical protein Bbelb_143500 [Branchiostoma belcheri]
MEQNFDAALPYERREKLRASRRRQWCQPFLKFPSAREHFRLLPTRAEDESRGLPRPFPTLCAHVTYPVRKGSWECAAPLGVICDSNATKVFSTDRVLLNIIPPALTPPTLHTATDFGTASQSSN